ncbi:MarR family transcriptional regulator [Candidatus Woesearchaeota archaeon]|nr:MarR family transcriptional regulator [Candidatus Woesearchaeota archaeon]
MKNKNVGIIIIGIAVLIGFIVFSFNRAMTDIVSTSCSHGESCPMWGTINFQTNVSLGIMVFVILVGLYLVFFAKEQKIITKTVKEQVKPKKITKENYQKIMKDLNEEEKLVLEKIIESEGTIFQSDLVDKTGFTKVKVTRILDKLEGKNILERKRRGMTNVVILKH